jgi:hypothetical protein
VVENVLNVTTDTYNNTSTTETLVTQNSASDNLNSNNYTGYENQNAHNDTSYYSTNTAYHNRVISSDSNQVDQIESHFNQRTNNFEV